MLKKLTEREHIIQRPAMYIGATSLTTSEEMMIDFEKKTSKIEDIKYVPGFIKTVNEIIDNCVDVAIKNDFKVGDQISIEMKPKFIVVTDNGTGIPVKKTADDIYMPELAWGHARAGSNFDDDKNRTQLGMNGVGSFATNCFSKKFIGITDDGTNRMTITFKNNAESFTHNIEKSKGAFTTVKFYPDFEKFGMTEVDAIHMKIIHQRLLNLSMCYPEITFKFNKRKVNVKSFSKYVQLFADNAITLETDDYRFAIAPNSYDDFKQFTYVNGLKIPDGGSHVDYITNYVVNIVRDKLQKKYKNIKPADIRNKLTFIGFFTNLKDCKFNSQAKEKITNTRGEITTYLGDVDLDKFAQKILKSKDLIDSITEVYRIKEEFKRRKEMNALKKPVKKIKSEKYKPATKNNKILFITEGESATGGLMPVFGRSDIGYYDLKGVPLNVMQATNAKFLQNTELSELYTIILQEGYTKIVVATDADLDGIHIRGMIFGFIQKMLPEFKDKVGILYTPVKYVKKKKVPQRWSYDLSGDLTPKSGEEFKYVKGLGTWIKEDLQFIIKKDGIEKMIRDVNFDSDEIINDWMLKDTAKRKEYILKNTFSIAKL